MKQTSKKQKFVGSKIYIDKETGEEVPMQVSKIEDRDFNFTKVWLEHLVTSWDNIANQKLRLAFWIINNLDRENQLVMTQRKIADKSGMSLATVNKTIKSLCTGEIPFLQKINSGAYRVNPDVMFKGSHNARMGVVFDYSQTQNEQNDNKKTLITNDNDQSDVDND